MIAIDKNVPAPKNESSGIRGRKYPLREMAVGDSILVDGSAAKSDSRCPAYSAAMTHAWRTGKRFSGRKEGEGKVRIWRVE